MNRWLGAAVLLLAVLLVLGRDWRPAAGGEPGLQPGGRPAAPRPEVGYPAPDFALPGLDGGTVRLSDYRGKVVMLNFWATWCPPCRAEMPEIAKLVARGIPDLVVIGVDLAHTEPSPQAVADFMRAHGYGWPVALDARGDVTLAYRVVQIPTTFFIDPNGVIRGKYLGPMTLPIMEDLVRQARRGG